MKSEAIDTVRYWMDNHPFTNGRVIVHDTPDQPWNFEVYLGGVLYGIGRVILSDGTTVPRKDLREMWRCQRDLDVPASIWFCDPAMGDVFYVTLHTLEKNLNDLEQTDDGYVVPGVFLQGIGKCGM